MLVGGGYRRAGGGGVGGGSFGGTGAQGVVLVAVRILGVPAGV